jgi:hypothetical protein
MTKWMYTTAQFITRGLHNDDKAGETEAMMNQLGSDGWELVSSTLYHNSDVGEDVILLTFKKPVG